MTYKTCQLDEKDVFIEEYEDVSETWHYVYLFKSIDGNYYEVWVDRHGVEKYKYFYESY